MGEKTREEEDKEFFKNSKVSLVEFFRGDPYRGM